jgi:hypothetical protein
MVMGPAAAAAAGAAPAFAGRGVTSRARSRRGKHREFLRELRRAALGAFGPLPIPGPNQDFAVRRALLAMKLVNRHEGTITVGRKNLKCGTKLRWGDLTEFFIVAADVSRLKIICGELERTHVRCYKMSRRQFFTMRQMVAVPADQGGVAGVFKKEFQRRRFNVAVTE